MRIRVFTVIFATSCALLAQTTYNSTASRTFGQPAASANANVSASPLASGSPNLVEGRELYLPQSLAFDTASNPQIVYVVDTFNHRVLAWKNPSSLTKGNSADLVVGQISLSMTRKGGPNTAQTAGLAFPTSVAVDSSGNLYVSDAGNNRILRFPKPFSQTTGFLAPDLVIGQRTFSSGLSANQGAAIPSAKTLALSSSSAIYANSMVFDPQGNLWVTDPGNNRVLRFPSSQLPAGTVEPAADLVLGQVTFDVSKNVEPTNPLLIRLRKSGMYQPSGLAFDSAGNLYVSDSTTPSGWLGRVLFFRAPVNTNGMAATRVLGIPTPSSSDQNPRAFNGCPTTAPFPCEAALGSTSGRAPQGIAVLNNSLYVADPGNARIVKYDNPNNWAAECAFDGNTVCASGQISPPAIGFVGQQNGQSVKDNQSGQPSASTVATPVGLAFLGTDLWIADSGNNRVTVWSPAGGAYPQASKVLGQVDFGYNAPNLAEGKELFVYDPVTSHVISGLGTSVGGAVAVDSTGSTPRLYIADTFNNRVLGFRDARKVRPGQPADLVIGQLDTFSTSANYQTHDAAAPTDSSLNNPVGLLVSPVGDLYIADTGNSRVVRFPRPFEQTGTLRANLVLGQVDYFSRFIDPTPNNMRAPWGLAFTSAGHLLVSDWAHNRVLLFKKNASGDFNQGQAASAVIGQPDFFTVGTGNTTNRFSSPRGISTDSSDRLYVADSGNNRISIFSNAANGDPDPSARATPAIGQPVAVAINKDSGEAWVTDVGGSRLLRFPIYEDWVSSIVPGSTGGIFLEQIVSSRTLDTNFPSFPLSVALDASGNPVVLESNNQVAFYYMQAQFRNLFSYTTRGLTPGMLAYVFRLQGPPLLPGQQTVSATVPLPTTLADMQVLFNGKPAPIYQVTTSYLVFQVPWSAPTSGTADVSIVRASTQEILTTASFSMHTADPGLATLNAQGFGQLAVSNADGTVNSPTNAAARGSVISLYGTGIGPVSGAPADGAVPTGAVSAPALPRVSMANPGPGVLDSSNIQYFGLVTWFPGVFQLNVKIPETVPPNSAVNVGIVWQDYLSTDGPLDSATRQPTRVITTIAVR